MKTAAPAAVLALSLPLTGCLVVSYSSGSGWYVWPGSLIITAIMALLYLALRHR
jgi:protein-S-isoprenylcysteine O-methyltransferase Ste14